MKKLSLIGMRGEKLCEVLVNVVGDDLCVNFDVPLCHPISHISLEGKTELKEELLGMEEIL